MTTIQLKPSPAGTRVLLALLGCTIPFSEGCVSHIVAYRTAADDSGARSRVAIPLFPSRRVNLYWADIGVFSPPKAQMPDREHAVVGHVTVNTDWLWGYPAVPAIEWALQRGATGLGADAVLVEEYDIAGPFMEVYGLAVKWNTVPVVTRPSGEDG